MMDVILKRPGRAPEVVQLDNTLEALQAAVGGYIETVTIAADVCFICNEEGRLLGMPYNGRFLGVDFVGPVLVAGIDGEEFCGLTREQISRLLPVVKEVE